MDQANAAAYQSNASRKCPVRNRKQHLKSMLGMIKNVSLEKETPAYKYMEVTLDAVKISDAVETAVKQEDKKQPAEVERGFAIGRLALLAAGDIKYQVKIDKASQTIRELNMDLTEPIRKGADLFVTAEVAKRPSADANIFGAVHADASGEILELQCCGEYCDSTTG